MIKFLDLREINRRHADELKSVAADVVDSGWYVRGGVASASKPPLRNTSVSGMR
nr:hypothetical protein [Prosthecochloris sp. GSB1]